MFGTVLPFSIWISTAAHLPIWCNCPIICLLCCVSLTLTFAAPSTIPLLLSQGLPIVICFLCCEALPVTFAALSIIPLLLFHGLLIVYPLSTFCLPIVYPLSAYCLPLVYPLSIPLSAHCLPLIYCLTAPCLPIVYPCLPLVCPSFTPASRALWNACR